jgi:hypothetical protein
MTPLSEQEEADVLLGSIGHAAGSRRCPCGCGQELVSRHSRRNIVCYDTWRKSSVADRMVLMVPDAPVEECRAAARRLLELAHRIRAERGEAAP